MKPTPSAYLPRGFEFWPEDAIDLQVEKVVEMYANGFAGAYLDDVAKGEFEDFITSQSFGNLDGDAVAHANGLTGTGEGRLVIPYVFALEYYPGSLPGPGQEVGDCVSWGSKNAGFITFCCDIKSGKPDEETGIVEGAPFIPPEGILQGAMSPEGIYWYRGYDGHGWQCEKAAQVVCQDSALWIRQPYPELELDLTKYSGKLASKYGQRKPPEEFTQTGRKHLIRTSTRVKTAEEARDFIANGYGILSCGSEGFSSTRDENGVSSRKGSWSHAMAFIGFDDREETKRRYNGPLVLVQNSWGKWNRGSRRILGTDIDIPEGSFWAKWSDVSRRSMLAFSGANGWPAKKLPAINFIVG